MLEERLKLVRNTKRSNCIGTALFLVGLYEEDRFLSPKAAYERYLSNLEELDLPEIGCLVSFGKTFKVAHLGVVTSLEPLKVTEREWTEGPFSENSDFWKLKRTYEEDEDNNISFYRVPNSEAVRFLSLFYS